MENQYVKGKKQRPIWRWTLLSAAAIAAIVAGTVGYVVHASGLKPNYWPTREWRTATPEEEGMDSATLAGLFDQLDGKHLHSMVIVRNGYIVAEAYNHDLNASSKVHVLSVTKSIMSALAGIAINEGKFKGIGQTIYETFPDWPAFSGDDGKKQLTLQHLMTMSTGLAWDNTNEKSTNEMMGTDDWAQYYISQPLAAQPGTQFMYSNGSAHMVSAMLQKRLGEPTSQYAAEKLFKPLGISDVEWPADPSGTTIGAWGVHLTTREMAKFGQLYLMQGNWEGQQIVPKDWVELSTREYVTEEGPDGDRRGYGYFWWIRALDHTKDPASREDAIFSAIGSGGQRIAVIPKYNMVVAFTANNSDAFFTNELLDRYILSSVKSSRPLKENAAGQALLKQKIGQFKQTSDPGSPPAEYTAG